MTCGNCSCRQGRDCPQYKPKAPAWLRLVKKYDAEIIGTLLVLVFLACTGYITEKDRQIEIGRLCQDNPGLPECDTIPKSKEK